MEKRLFRDSNDLDRLSDLTNQIDNLLREIRFKFDKLQMEIGKLNTENINKITKQILEKNSGSLLEIQEYSEFKNLDIRSSIEYLTSQIYYAYGTTSIFHFLDLDDTCWSESLRLNLFKTLRSLFINFYKFYASSYMALELTQESEMVMVDLKFKGCKLLNVNESCEHRSIEFLIQKMSGVFTINYLAGKQVDITLEVPLYP